MKYPVEFLSKCKWVDAYFIFALIIAVLGPIVCAVASIIGWI